MSIDLFSLSAKASTDAAAEAPRARRPKEHASGDLALKFSDLLSQKVEDLDAVQRKSEEMDTRFAAGDPNVQIHDVTIAAAQANLALETAMQFRTLALRAVERLINLR